MYTQEIKRRKSNSYFQLKTIGSPDNKGKVIQKLGSSIYTSMDTLQSLKSKILVANFKQLKYLVESFRKQHQSLRDKQKSLFQIDQNSDKLERLKIKVKEFLQNFTTDQIQAKLKNMKEEKQQIFRQTNQQLTNQSQQLQLQQQLLQGKNYRKAVLEEEQKQIIAIGKMMTDVKQVSLDMSSLILGIGQKINIAETNIRQARLKIQNANKQLVQTNQYQRDTNKTKILFGSLICIVVFIILLILIAAHK